MVFSFFKRKGDEPPPMTPPKPVVPKSMGGEVKTPAQARVPIPPAVAEVVEFDELAYDTSMAATAESHSAVEEAAILYANERLTEAISVLQHFIKENTDQRNLNPWLLLFDLYQIQGMKQQFDELSMEFVVKFERSAPVWEGARPMAKAGAPATPKKGMASTVQLKGVIGTPHAAEIERMLGLADADGGVKLDLSAATGIAAVEAAQLTAALQQIRRAKQRITVAGAKPFVDIIKVLVAGMGREEKAYWGLMFELYQMLGLQNEFEDAAIDYAVTFELSPPSWETLPETVQASTTTDTATLHGTVSETESAMFVFEGVLSSESEYKLRDLERYAESRQEVHIDMTGTSRVDFVTVGSFIGTLVTLNQQNKKVVIRGANGLVHALFDVMGVTDYATIVRKKSR